MIATMLGPRLRYVATLLVVGCALAGCGGYVLLWDWALAGLRDRAAVRLGAYEHIGFFADALRVVYTLLFCAAVLGAAGVVVRNHRQSRWLPSLRGAAQSGLLLAPLTSGLISHLKVALYFVSSS